MPTFDRNSVELKENDVIVRHYEDGDAETGQEWTETKEMIMVPIDGELTAVEYDEEFDLEYVLNEVKTNGNQGNFTRMSLPDLFNDKWTFKLEVKQEDGSVKDIPCLYILR